ncbi:MAG TPA: TfoX/Sxy family protein [Solirubrobacteraceae bacterium]|nr:TfoX/Sxy family protein [Solirubrobacteraceae bacterium]
MAYDEELAERVRAMIDGEPGVTEKRMFGGLAFLVGGNMSVTVSDDGLLLRGEPDEFEALRDAPGVDRFVMQNRQMKGWLRVATSAVADDATLAPWVERSLAFARGLPAKTS